MITLGSHLSLVEDRLDYAPGDTLAGVFSVGEADLAELSAVELSVMWHTEGKGDEDLAVHYFRRWGPNAPSWLELKLMQPFATRLPLSPLSYAGAIVKICWSVRLRMCARRGKDMLHDLPFRVGRVPPADVAPVDPGTGEPRTVDPGTAKPGTGEPRTAKPGNGEPRNAGAANGRGGQP